jgi:hypothetical protein
MESLNLCCPDCRGMLFSSVGVRVTMIVLLWIIALIGFFWVWGINTSATYEAEFLDKYRSCLGWSGIIYFAYLGGLIIGTLIWLVLKI